MFLNILGIVFIVFAVLLVLVKLFYRPRPRSSIRESVYRGPEKEVFFEGNKPYGVAGILAVIGLALLAL